MMSKKGMDIPIWPVIIFLFLLIMFIGLAAYNGRVNEAGSFIGRLLG